MRILMLGIKARQGDKFSNIIQIKVVIPKLWGINMKASIY